MSIFPSAKITLYENKNILHTVWFSDMITILYHIAFAKDYSLVFISGA